MATRSPRGSATASPFLSRSGSPVMIEQGEPCLPCVEPLTARDARRQLFVGCVTLFIGLALLSLSVVGFFVLRSDISSGVRTGGTLDDSTTREYREWADDTFDPVVLSVYLYHLTNPHEVLVLGQPPSLEEVGPFVYHNVKLRVNKTWTEDRKLLSYRTMEQYHFQRHLSVDDDSRVINTVNMPYMLAQGLLYPAKSSLLETEEDRGALAEGYGSLPEAHRLFSNRTVHEMLFGYVDTTKLHFPGLLHNMTAANMTLPPSTIYTGRDSTDVQYRAYQKWRGTPLVVDPLNVTQPAWGTAEASSVDGCSDGSQIAPGAAGDGHSYRLLNTAALRCVRMQNVADERATFKGVHCVRFRLDPRELLSAKHYAPNAAYNQELDGFYYVAAAAAGDPAMVSRPHLAGTPDSVRNAVVVAYSANLTEDDFIDVEPTSGATMHLVQRSQINYQLQPLPGMPVLGPNHTVVGETTYFANLSSVVLPSIWFQDEAGVTDDDASRLRGELYTAQKLDHVSLYVGAPIGFVIAVVGAMMLHYARRRLAELERQPLLEKTDESLLADEPPGELLDGTGVGLYGSTGGSAPQQVVRPTARRAAGPVTVTGSPRDIIHTRSPPGGPRSPSSSRRPRGGSVGGDVDISYA